MSVPKSKILSASKGFLAQADVRFHSPSQSQTNNQSVNIVVTTAKDKEGVEKEEPKKEPVTHASNEIPPYPVYPSVFAEPVVEREVKIEPEVKPVLTRDVSDLISDREKLIEALNLIIDIQQNNPLIINKYMVAEEETFIKLIKLFTDSDSVELLKVDPDTSCTCKIKYEIITKIIVKKNGEIYNLKYNYPDVIEELDNRRISYKLVC